ncbi:serine protease [Streptomyces sp. NPDC050546]|uniref:serine protease n=1 Tax=Streptomyces sp. NPDC050546 TaxID=3365628 RepID=UPI0037AA4F84
MRYYGHMILALARVDGAQGRLLGTCFPVAPRHLATAMHVVGPNDANMVALFPTVTGGEDYQDTTVTESNFLQVRIVEADPIRDICILELSPGNSAEFSYQLSGTDMIPPGADVDIYGFPHMDSGRRVVTVQRSQVGAKVLIPNQGIKNKHIVVNTHVRPGQSGGPVFDVQRGTVCAMVTGSYTPAIGGSFMIGGVDPSTLHQTGHAVSAEYIKDMIS